MAFTDTSPIFEGSSKAPVDQLGEKEAFILRLNAERKQLMKLLDVTSKQGSATTTFSELVGTLSAQDAHKVPGLGNIKYGSILATATGFTTLKDVMLAGGNPSTEADFAEKANLLIEGKLPNLQIKPGDAKRTAEHMLSLNERARNLYSSDPAMRKDAKEAIDFAKDWSKLDAMRRGNALALAQRSRKAPSSTPFFAKMLSGLKAALA